MTILKTIETYITVMQKKGTPVKSMALALNPNVYLILESELSNRMFHSVINFRRFTMMGVTVGYDICYNQDQFKDYQVDELFNAIFNIKP